LTWKTGLSVNKIRTMQTHNGNLLRNNKWICHKCSASNQKIINIFFYRWRHRQRDVPCHYEKRRLRCKIQPQYTSTPISNHHRRIFRSRLSTSR
jgi:hypothetical protein